MNANGVMEEIRNLLRAGRSSTETIALGYKPSTVYKAQRQLARSTSIAGPPATTQVLITNMASEDSTRLREQILVLREQVSSLAEVTADRDSFKEQLDSAFIQMEDLAVRANQAQMWQERWAEVEPAVAEADDLRREVHFLNRHLGQFHEVLTQEVHQWQVKLQQEQQSRWEADNLVAQRGSQIVQLKTENQSLAQQLEEAPGFITEKFLEAVRPLLVELEQLRPLKVWDGHPCSKCRKPISGGTSREVASRLLWEGGYGHANCVKKWSLW